MEVRPMQLECGTVIGVVVDLPQTRLLSINTARGYITCGALDVQVVDRVHPERDVIAARIFKVRTLEDLLAGRVESSTRKAQELGIVAGITGAEALARMM
ncbi:MAG: DUF1805 domain-containing protein [bacterium]|nr:DUF1805 domain-containing protein [bacterium]